MSFYTYWRGRWRLRFGWCPACASSPPREDCVVCDGAYDYGPGLPAGRRRLWRERWDSRRRPVQHVLRSYGSGVWPQQMFMTQCTCGDELNTMDMDAHNAFLRQHTHDHPGAAFVTPPWDEWFAVWSRQSPTPRVIYGEGVDDQGKTWGNRKW